MDRNELKKVLKPVIKECIREALYEDGILSKIVSECVKGLGGISRPVLEENTAPSRRKAEPVDDTQKEMLVEANRIARAELEETKQRIAKVTGFGNKIFENVMPAIGGAEPSKAETGVVPTSATGTTAKAVERRADKGGLALRNMDPNDPGVNLTGILKLIGGKGRWQDHLKKEER